MIKIKAKYYLPKKLKIILSVIFILLIIGIILNIREQSTLIYNEYTVESDKIDNKVRIVQLTDLHNKYYGKDNIDLIDMVKAKNPDVIAVTGDMTSTLSENNEITISLLQELNKITYVYYSLGNHENELENLEEFTKQVESTGTILLIDEFVNTNINGNNIAIGGVDNYAFPEDLSSEGKIEIAKTAQLFIENFSDVDDFKLLLCHYPEYFMWRYSEYGFDLVLAGHTHGGSIVSPYFGGLLAPEQGVFPEYDSGYFELNNSKMIISSGLGSGGVHKLRINNPPEVTVIDLI